ncbi:DUF2269 family protein [Amycolatopsis nigrescens]|uniref:DUF2269 family protein n=1 Tax=Amycolatopsis nigrescens TaxID=381445 RepID=UPI00035C88ED|nr:DUF2269 family protein [Amycolatopsis nigrescens]
MTELLLTLHVLAGLLFIGPVTVATSLFPRYVRERNLAAALLLNRVSRVYALMSVTVPVFGLALALRTDVLTEAWLLASLVLTVVAAVVLGLLVVPGQKRLLAGLRDDTTDPKAVRMAAMPAGIFALLWVVVAVLMVLRPGA